MTAAKYSADRGVRNPTGGTAGHDHDGNGQDDMPGVRPPLPGAGTAPVNGPAHLPEMHLANEHAPGVPDSGYEYTRRVETSPDVSWKGRFVAQTLERNVNWNPDDPRYGKAWPSANSLAERMGVSVSTVWRGLAELTDAGLLATIGCSICDADRGYRSPTGGHSCQGEGHTAVRELRIPQKVSQGDSVPQRVSPTDTQTPKRASSKAAASEDVPTREGKSPANGGPSYPGQQAPASSPDGPDADDASDADPGLSAGAAALAGINGVSAAEAAELVEQYGGERVARVAREAQRRRPPPHTPLRWVTEALAQGWDAGWADDSEPEAAECADTCPGCGACVCVCVCEVCGQTGGHDDVERATECERERRRRNRDRHGRRPPMSESPRASSPAAEAPGAEPDLLPF